MIGCGTSVSPARPEIGAPVDVASKAATKSLFVFIDECLLDFERCCHACATIPSGHRAVTGLAGQLVLEVCDAQPAQCERGGAVLARCAAAGDIAAAAHNGSSLPVCSATMYAAYQSGQFSSRWPPVRVSCSPWRLTRAALRSPDP